MKTLKTFFYSLKRSLFDPEYYEDVRKASFGFSLKYLWFILFVFTVIVAGTLTAAYIGARPQITPFVNNVMRSAQNFYPQGLELKIRNGQLSTNVKEPFIFEINNNYQKPTKHFLIIDTQGSIENYPYYNTYVLATKNAVVYPSKSRSGESTQISVFYFRDLKNDFTMNRAKYDLMIEKVRPYAGRAVYFVDWFAGIVLVFVLIFGSIFWTISALFGLLFMTFVVWIISLIFRKQYTYGSLYKMGMHAVTWPILVGETVKYLRLPIPNLYFLIFLVFMLVVMFSGKKAATAKAKK